MQFYLRQVIKYDRPVEQKIIEATTKIRLNMNTMWEFSIESEIVDEVEMFVYVGSFFFQTNVDVILMFRAEFIKLNRSVKIKIFPEILKSNILRPTNGDYLRLWNVEGGNNNH